VKKTIIRESPKGAIFRVDKIPNTLFNFFILKSDREFKDGTATWKICVEYPPKVDKPIVLDVIRGKRRDAERRLDEILGGKI
jgi:hypothetical protein